MTAKPLLRPCPICAEPQGLFLHHQVFATDAHHPLAAGYDVVACERCGFAFADTAATQADYDHFYATQSKYADSATSTGAGLSPWDAQRLRDMAADLAAFAGSREERIVDIGCANGGLLVELRRLGFTNLCGVDPAESCARETERLAGVPAFAGSLFDLPAEVGEVDGVVLSHVLEHVRDLLPALERIRARLRPGGWIYLETPDATRYREFVFAPFQDFNTEHINHFSGPALANLLRRGGFAPERGAQKTIASAADRPYPAVYSFGRKTDQTAAALEPDRTLVADLQDYIAQSRELMLAMDATIRATLAAHPCLIVWGTGQLTLKLLAETSLAQASIEAFLDNNPMKHGQSLHGAPIVAPRDLPNHTLPILIASTINQAAILESIRQLDLKNPVVTLPDRSPAALHATR